MSIIREFEANSINEIAESIVKNIDPANTKLNIEEIKENFKNREESFEIGDLVKVGVKIIEGKRERIQFFEGFVISFRGHGVTRSFKVRKIAFGVGVERTFPVYSPNIDTIEVVRKGRVRRAKLFYLRSRTGKKANVIEKILNKTASSAKKG